MNTLPSKSPYLVQFCHVESVYKSGDVEVITEPFEIILDRVKVIALFTVSNSVFAPLLASLSVVFSLWLFFNLPFFHAFKNFVATMIENTTAIANRMMRTVINVVWSFGGLGGFFASNVVPPLAVGSAKISN